MNFGHSLFFLLALTVLYTKGQSDVCPHTWTLPSNDSTNSCKCGDYLHGIVYCDIQTNQVYIRKCSCMTVLAEEQSKLIVASCIYNCWKDTLGDLGELYSKLPSEKQNVTDYICGDWNRRGELCSSCKKGYSPPLLSYDLMCMECDADSHTYLNGWLKLIVAGFLPVTIFYVMTLVFRFNAYSARLNGFILFAQIASAPPAVRSFIAYQRQIGTPTSVQVAGNVGFMLYGIWNLDFFITVLPQFCIPEFGTMEVLGVQLFIAAYPLLLILLTYILIELHARNVRVIVVLWKPFHKCSVRIRKQLGIKTPIMHVFATIFLLSYNKLLSISTDMLKTVTVWNTSGNVVKYSNFYLEGRINYLWYALLGTIAVLLILLIALMLIYPMRCFQNCLGKCCRSRSQLALKAFMDCFLGHFKDGTNGTRNCGCMAGCYFVVRIIVWITYALNSHNNLLIMAAGVLAICTLLVAVVRPYKKQYRVHNITDPIAFLLLGLTLICIDLTNSREAHTPWIDDVFAMLISIIVVIPLVYISTVALLGFRSAKLVRNVIEVVKRRRQPAQDNEEVQGLVDTR